MAAVVIAYLVLDEQMGPQDKEAATRLAELLSTGWESGQELFFAEGHCELHFRLPETGPLASTSPVLEFGPTEIADRLNSAL